MLGRPQGLPLRPNNSAEIRTSRKEVSRADKETAKEVGRFLGKFLKVAVGITVVKSLEVITKVVRGNNRMNKKRLEGKKNKLERKLSLPDQTNKMDLEARLRRGKKSIGDIEKHMKKPSHYQGKENVKQLGLKFFEVMGKARDALHKGVAYGKLKQSMQTVMDLKPGKLESSYKGATAPPYDVAEIPAYKPKVETRSSAQTPVASRAESPPTPTLRRTASASSVKQISDVELNKKIADLKKSIGKGPRSQGFQALDLATMVPQQELLILIQSLTLGQDTSALTTEKSGGKDGEITEFVRELTGNDELTHQFVNALNREVRSGGKLDIDTIQEIVANLKK